MPMLSFIVVIRSLFSTFVFFVKGRSLCSNATVGVSLVGEKERHHIRHHDISTTVDATLLSEFRFSSYGLLLLDCISSIFIL
jgi:hypothetical protein